MLVEIDSMRLCTVCCSEGRLVSAVIRQDTVLSKLFRRLGLKQIIDKAARISGLVAEIDSMRLYTVCRSKGRLVSVTWKPQVLANSFMSVCVLQCMVKVMGPVPFQTVVEMIRLILAI